MRMAKLMDSSSKERCSKGPYMFKQKYLFLISIKYLLCIMVFMAPLGIKRI